jgi:solute carrier family 25 carnitine/acylcarnitine transporter 20/29
VRQPSRMNDEIKSIKSNSTKMLCGGLAGCIGIVAGQPLDMLKIRLQTEPGVHKSAYSCFTQIIRNEGFKSLYKGMSAPIFTQFFQNGLIFTGESIALSYLDPTVNFDDENMSQRTVLNVFLAGSFGGFLQTFVLVPSDLVKVKMQVDHSSVGKKGLYSSSFDCLSKTYFREGIKGMYKGFGVTAIREVPAFGTYFFIYRYSLQSLNALFEGSMFSQKSTIISNSSTNNIISPPPSSGKIKSNPGLLTLIAGGMAGSSSWIIVYPFDVIKSHIQSTPAINSDGVIVKPLSGIQTAKLLYRKYGYSVFTRGMGITVGRAFPVNALVFYFNEHFRNHFNV